MVVFDEFAVGGGIDGADDVAILIPAVVYLAVGIDGQTPSHSGVHQPGSVHLIAEIEGNFIGGIAVAVGVHIAEGNQHVMELFHGGGHFLAYALQPLGVDILNTIGGMHTGMQRTSGQTVDIAIGIGLVFTPGGEVILVEVVQIGHVGLDFILGDHMPQLGVQGNDGIAHGLAAPEDVRQGRSGQQGSQRLFNLTFGQLDPVNLDVAGFFDFLRPVFLIVGFGDIGGAAGGGNRQRYRFLSRGDGSNAAQQHQRHQERKDALGHGVVPPLILSKTGSPVFSP